MNITEITLRQEISSRGGGIEIGLTTLGFKGHKMSAYQNYLGGGMLGAIQINDTIRANETNIPLQLEFSNRFKELDEIGEALMRHFHALTNHDEDEWESATFEENQSRPASSY
tara:strand:+ start:29562 stop:29900 length:339 start_codon:yes stop_codon:yes gene_type:complete